MADEKPTKMWLGKYPILDDEHIPGIEAQAAIHEFKDKLPRGEAEDKAHEGYIRDRAIESAAHHLLGLRSAHSVGSLETAQKHGAAYMQALKHLGADAFGPPPKELGDALKEMAHKYARFKSHPSDAFFEEPEADAEGVKPEPNQAKTALERIQTLRKLVSKAKEPEAENKDEAK